MDGLLHGLADVRLHTVLPVVLFLRARDHDQILYQSGHAVNLAHGGLRPFILAVHHFQDLRVGLDNGERGLELVAGVGDKGLLIFCIADLALDNSAGNCRQSDALRYR